MSRLIIDVREPREYSLGHAPGAINIPPQEIMEGSPQLENVDKSTELVLYCVSGSRSRMCSMILAQQGFNNIINGINQDHVIAKYC